MVNAPHTDLTGGGRARGRGFKPATMFADLDFAFGPSRIDTIAVDSIAVKAQLANGLANVARAEVRGSGAPIDVNGQFGLNSARHLVTTYSWTDARSTRSKMSVTLRGDTISAGGFGLDSVAADLSYLKPNGTVLVRVVQNNERDFALKGDFTLDKARNEVRLADVALRFDTTSWRTTHPSTVRWGDRGIEVVKLELENGGPERRIYANGLLPTEGAA